VERPGEGDVLRTFGPSVEGVPLWWLVEGRNKRSLTLDVSRPEGQELARELACRSDVLVENFRPGTMARWGLGYDGLAELNPRLVYVSVSGFGQRGRLSQRPAYDRIGQAIAGLTYLTGHPGGPPVKPGIGVTDYSTAITAALGATLALLARERDPQGRGQHVDAALTDTILRMYHYFIPGFQLTGAVPERTGNATESMVPAECFQTSDGHWLMVAAGSDRTFGLLARCMGMPELASDPRFLTNVERSAHQAEIHAIVRAWVAGRTRAEVQESLEAAGVPVAPLYSARDVYEEPHFRESGMVIEAEDPQLGRVATQGVTPRLSRTPGSVRSTGPALGEANRDVYCGLLGHSERELEEWSRQGVI
jgi:crotonobetainyl-CoA:carnitine CoA-transferase CaiB-like acyl-CoA transferase